MKVTVKENWRGDYTVELKQGHQSFRLDYEGSRKKAEWYARMFRIALRRHNAEKAKKRK